MPSYVENNNYRNIGVTRNSNADSRVSILNNTVDVISEYQYGLERLASSNQGLSNPPFKLTSNNNHIASSLGLRNSKILRGYIRRSDIDASDPTSNQRLYFMYNPETIERNYMAYLDQQSLDPYNTMFGSNNMTAPPGILDFSFELLFDRQLEVATDPSHPGTKVDYDYFDLVVRGVVGDTSSSGNAIPDNGIMMINPRNIAVVFGPELTVHGRPYNASVRFEKFNNKMTPTRMSISITMKAFYIGPVQTLPNYSEFTSESIFEATIPFDENLSYQANFVDVTDAQLTDTVSNGNTVNANFSGPFSSGSGNGYNGPPGVRPADIPQGPFPVRVVRQGNSMITSNVAPVTLSDQQILGLLLAQECPIEGATFLWALAKRESGFVANVAGVNTNGTMDVGIWQINQVNWGGLSAEQITDPWTNVSIAMRLSNNGTRFVPWQLSGNYKTPDGSHLRSVNMDEARAFVAANTPQVPRFVG